MSILLKAYRNLLTDVFSLSGLHLCAPDLDMNWVLKEGPMLDKQLLCYLENELVLTWTDVISRQSIPEWLTPLWEGFMLKHDPLLLRYLRQVLVFGYKARLEPTNEQNNEAQASFYNRDCQVADYDLSLEKEIGRRPHYWRLARSLVSRVIGDIRWHDVVPSHGPGAVFPRYDHYDRTNFTSSPRSIEEYYSFYENFVCLPGFYPSAIEATSISEKFPDTGPIRSKLVSVPKDSRGPRLISVHPRESIWIQQGQRRLLESAIMKHIGSQISLRDQSVNGDLALAGSRDRSWFTIDLKEASDCMSCGVVKYLFGDYAYHIISCSRAEEIQLFDGRVIPLHKWAPMGNALCFPVESLVFWALAQAAVYMSPRKSSECRVYVFGDDIIGPSTYYDDVVRGLTDAGLTVNKGKSFVQGFFRESCGTDAYKGVDVTPRRLKTHVVSNYEDLVSICTMAKSLRADGYEETASTLYVYVRSFVGHLPMVNDFDQSGVFEYVERDIDYLWRFESKLRWSQDLHRYEVNVARVVAAEQSPSDTRWCLLDALLSLERARSACSTPSDGCNKSGLHYTVPHRACLKRGWTGVRHKWQRPVSRCFPECDNAFIKE